MPDRKVRPKKSHPQWPGKISGRHVSKAPAPLRPLEGRGLLPRELVVAAQRYPLPFDGSHWNPWQVLAWIISRNSKMVEHMASDGQSALKKWKAVDWCIEAQQAEARGAKKVLATFETALAAMAYAAETGLVTACGCIRYDKGPGRRQSISSHFWTNGITLDDSILKTHPNSMHAGLRTVDWLGVWFDRPSVLQIWEDSIEHVEPIARSESKKSWKARSGCRLTPGETAILDAKNALWPDGKVDHKASGRDKSIGDWLKIKNQSKPSTRAIVRALGKIEFA